MRHLYIFIIALTGLLTFEQAAISQPEAKVTVIGLSGRAEYMKSGKTEWVRLKSGRRLGSGDNVRTYKKASVDIAFDSDGHNVVSIKENTHVVLKLEKNEKINLIDGEVFALVKALEAGSQFEIRTPTAVCGARGTGWGADADGNKTTVSAYEKDSYAKGLDKNGNPAEDNMIVRQGFRTTVKRLEKPSRLIKISERDMKRWGSWKDELASRFSGKRTARAARMAERIDRMEAKTERAEEMRDEERIESKEEKAAQSKQREPHYEY